MPPAQDTGPTPPWDAVVIGGGFYGCAVAAYLARRRGMGAVLLLEQEAALMQRASYNNQARVHNGYHYPRSFTTAQRSRVNLPNFVRDWPAAVHADFIKLYAIARRNSKVTARQFQRFCKEIGAVLQPADTAMRQLFDSRYIEDVFVVQEYAFDSSRLAALALADLQSAGVQMRLGHTVTALNRGNGALVLQVQGPGAGTPQPLQARHVFNCTYSGLNHIGGDYPGAVTQLKHELTEMALVEVPPALRQVGVTVMDGPFFSCMPFPSQGLHTLSHVRYTPHAHWADTPAVHPYQRLAGYERDSRFDRMLRDSTRYLPALDGAIYRKSLFEVKTILCKNEGDDGRPILFEKSAGLPGLYSILGGKIDNIYDVLEKLDAQPLA